MICARGVLSTAGCGAVVALLACIAGCAGSAHIELAALDYKMIDPPAPKFAPIDARQCYWWTAGDGKVWVAIEQYTESVLFGKSGAFLFQLSLELKDAPAGRARNYLVEQRELRAIVKIGPAEIRFQSLAGIVALYRDRNSPDHLRGSFRLLVGREVSQVLGGWSRGTNVLMLGSFEAVRDEARGKRIADATEGNGWQRDAAAQPDAPRKAPSDAPASAPIEAPASRQVDSSARP